ncbi:hypothetical protein D3C72_1069630 [compost metagenome]
MLAVAERQERRQHHQQGAQVEVTETPVVRQVTGVARDQVTVQHLPGRIGEVGQLQQQETDKEVRADAVETNDCRTRHRDQRCHQCPRVEAPVQGIFDQGHVQRREDGEQQHFRHGQHPETQVQANIGDAVLQRADQQHRAHEARLDLTPAGQGQKHQSGQQYPRQHGEVTVHMSSQVLADQAEGKRLDQRDDQ